MSLDTRPAGATVRSMLTLIAARGRLAATFTLMVCLPAMAQTETPTADELTRCARANAPQETFKQHAELETVRADGDSRTLYIRLLARKSRDGVDANLRVLNPPDLSGMSFLVLADADEGDAMFTFVPALNRSRRVTGNASSQSLWGTDFTYADVRQLLGTVGGGTATRRADSSYRGTPVHVLDLTPAEQTEIDYARIVMALEPTHCVPVHVQFLSESDAVIRELEVDPESIEQAGERHFARRMTMYNRQTQSRTRVELSRVEFDETIPRRAFHPRGYESVD